MAKKTRKINVNEVAKTNLHDTIVSALAGTGLTVISGEAMAPYGFKSNTILVKGVDGNGTPVDIKVELSSPRTGVTVYETADVREAARLAKAEAAE